MTTKNFDDAKKTCNGVNGKMFEPRSKEINDDVATEARKLIGDDRWYWLGITDKVSEGNWSYNSNGQTISFENWFSGQPATIGGENENCVEAGHLSYNGKWHDVPCSWDWLFFICEFSGNFKIDCSVKGKAL